MADSIQVPNNVDDPTILKRFLTQLVSGLSTDPYYSGNVVAQNEVMIAAMQANPNLDFLNIASKLNELRTDIQTYIADKIETVILQNSDDIAVIAQQFGTFYNQALAASWYGLSVKAGGAVAGLEVGSLDPDVTTPGDESSYFRVVANNFILGRAYEDLTQTEKDYLAANGLPNFGTVYNASKQPVPALITSWDNSAGTYKHYFNGIVQFSNVQNADYAGAINNGITTINGGKITTNSITSDRIASYNITATNTTFGSSIIGNAQIQDLSVNTLKLADQAVTIPISAINYNQVGFAQSYVEVVAIGFTSSGAPIDLFFSAILNAGSLRSVNAKVTRDGTAIYDSVTTSVGQSAGQYGNIVFNLRDTCGYGYHEYRFYLLCSTGTTYATLSSILGLEVKK